MTEWYDVNSWGDLWRHVRSSRMVQVRVAILVVVLVAWLWFMAWAHA